MMKSLARGPFPESCPIDQIVMILWGMGHLWKLQTYSPPLVPVRLLVFKATIELARGECDRES